jgi:hypothetical protein
VCNSGAHLKRGKSRPGDLPSTLEYIWERRKMPGGGLGNPLLGG